MIIHAAQPGRELNSDEPITAHCHVREDTGGPIISESRSSGVAWVAIIRRHDFCHQNSIACSNAGSGRRQRRLGSAADGYPTASTATGRIDDKVPFVCLACVQNDVIAE